MVKPIPWVPPPGQVRVPHPDGERNLVIEEGGDDGAGFEDLVAPAAGRHDRVALGHRTGSRSSSFFPDGAFRQVGRDPSGSQPPPGSAGRLIHTDENDAAGGENLFYFTLSRGLARRQRRPVPWPAQRTPGFLGTVSPVGGQRVKSWPRAFTAIEIAAGQLGSVSASGGPTTHIHALCVTARHASGSTGPSGSAAWPSKNRSIPGRHRLPDPVGIVTSRMHEIRPGLVSSKPRGRWCAPGQQ